MRRPPRLPLRPRAALPTLALLAAVGLALTGCAGVRPRADVSRAVAEVDADELMHSVETLCAFGPRPVGLEAPTRNTLRWLRRTLEGLGYEVTEETFGWPRRAELFAVVNVPGSDEEIRLLQEDFHHFFSGAPLGARAEALREQGWEVRGFSGRAPETPEVHQLVNLIAEKRGTTRPDRVVEVSAHYDTVPGSPGADDDASGCAALLEVARVLADVPTQRTLRLCFFAAEETGLDGSKVHVDAMLARAAAREDGLVEVDALINLDSVGFVNREPDSQDAPMRVPLVAWMPTTGDFLSVLGTWSTSWIGAEFLAVQETYVPELRTFDAKRIAGFFSDARRSDHAWYWDAGIPAVFLTDTTEFRGAPYHLPTDVPEAIDREFLRQVTQATLAATMHLLDR